ncbi:MAG TPA: hypothetical protein VG994_17320, partial [Steroidobacteraceae bacterium]|nr:hypothetical protein [Steroidobacteraceae bacterium]
VADGRWARVGSSNLNIASWLGNYELDAVIEHEPTALAMEQMYLADLENSREIVLQPRRRRYLERIGDSGHGATERASGAERADGERRDPFRVHGGSASRAAAGALRIGRAVGAALTEQRVLAQTEARTVAIVGVLLVGVAAVGILWPLAIAVPIAILALWMAISLFIRAHTLRMARKSRGLPPMRVGHAESQNDPRRSN